MKLQLMKAIQAGDFRVTKILILACVAMLFGCNSEPGTNKELLSLDETQVIEMLGKPEADFELTVEKGVSLLEYQGSLYDAVPESGSLTVRELTWKKDGKTIKVWLKLEGDMWIAFDNLQWSKNVRF